MAIDRKVFFAGVRQGPFPGKLSADQVRGMNELLDVWENVGFKNAWYPAVNFANVYRETGGRMMPVIETRRGDEDKNPSVDQAISRLESSWKRGKMPWVKTAYWRKDAQGRSWLGRGRIQWTWDYNYKAGQKRFGINIYDDPDILLRDSKLDAYMTVKGHLEGIWSSGKHPLSKYLDKLPIIIKDSDVVANKALRESRRGVNGLDHADEIASIAKQFYADLVAAGA